MKVRVLQQSPHADSTITLEGTPFLKASGLVAAAHPPPSNETGHGAQDQQGHDHTTGNAGAVKERDGKRNACDLFVVSRKYEKM